jgi:hypothetical protein
MGLCASKKQVEEMIAAHARSISQQAVLNSRITLDCITLLEKNATLQARIEELEGLVHILSKEQILVLHQRIQKEWGIRSQKGDKYVTQDTDGVQMEIRNVEKTIRCLEKMTTWEGTYSEFHSTGLTNCYLEHYGWDCGWGLGPDSYGFIGAFSSYTISKEERIRRAAPVFAILHQRLSVLKDTETNLSTLKKFVQS